MLTGNEHYFLTIAECGSLTKAAEKLFISQPSLSKYVKNLESRLGIELFDHRTSPLRLTEAGLRYLEYIKEASRAEKNLLSEFDEMRSGVRGTVRVGIPVWRCSIIMPAVLPAMRKKHPSIDIEVFEGSSSVIENSLLNNETDICLVNMPTMTDELVCENIMQEKLLLCGNKNHPLVKKAVSEIAPDDNGYRPFDIKLLDGENVIMQYPGQNIARMVSTTFAKHEVTPGKMWKTQNITTALNMVSKDEWFTFIPEACAKSDLHPEGVVFFTVDKPALAWSFVAAYKKKTPLSRPARIFIDEVKAHFGMVQN